MKKSLAEQIAELEDVLPTEFDVEEDFPDRGANAASDDDGGSDNDARAAREHYVDVGPSSLRKLNQQLDNSDPKYIGVKTTRSQLLDDHHDETDDSEDESRPDAQDSPAHSSASASASPSDSEDTPPSPQSPAPPTPSLHEHSLTSTLLASRLADRKKGKAIARQLRLWDSLVDARIRIQKGVLGANVLPTPALAAQYQSASPRTNEAVQNLLREGLALSEELFELQQTLSELQDVKLPARKRRKLDVDPANEILHFDEQLAASTQDFVALESSLHPTHLLTLQKWSSKIQSVAPSALALSAHKRTSFLRSSSSSNSAGTKGAVEMIAEQVDDGAPGREKVLGRTRVRRGVGRGRIGIGLVVDDSLEGEETGGKKGAEGGEGSGMGEGDGEGEVFDDTDFYQEILRDVISSKSGQLNPESYPTRPPKSKKPTVDTKASKGRKLRYETHEKIRNFMVPSPFPSRVGGGGGGGVWHEEQIDELFSSLLGRGFGSGEGKGVEEERGEGEEEVEVVGMGGLRVF